MPAPSPVRLASATGRWIVLGSVLGSSLAGIDSTVVTIALPSIGRQMHAGFATLQWTVTGYTLTLAALMLLGGALGDQFGRRRIFLIGVLWFATASLLCAAAPDTTWLVGARALQGVGGALMTPGSLAIIEASLVEKDRGAAIGAWSGMSGAASAIAPFLGGWLLAVGSWRWVFLINPLLAVPVAAITLRHIPETRDPDPRGGIDVAGSALGVLGLGAVTAGAITASDRGFASGQVLALLATGSAALMAFVFVERRSARPTLPPRLFRSRQFSATNAVTFVLYAANAAAFLFLVIELQTVSGYSPLLSGAALLPVTVVMLLLSSRFGARGQRIGPRRPMVLGPCISAAGLLLTTRLSAHSAYLTGVLPAVTLFGFGLAVSVAPLTSTVLAAVPPEHVGVASGINNAVARAAGLLAIALLPALTGLTGDTYRTAALFLPPFREAMWICVALQVVGAALAALLISNDNVLAVRGCVGLSGDPHPAPALRRGASQPVLVPQPADAGFGNVSPAAVDRQ